MFTSSGIKICSFSRPIWTQSDTIQQNQYLETSICAASLRDRILRRTTRGIEHDNLEDRSHRTPLKFAYNGNCVFGTWLRIRSIKGTTLMMVMMARRRMLTSSPLHGHAVRPVLNWLQECMQEIASNFITSTCDSLSPKYRARPFVTIIKRQRPSICNPS